MRSFNQRSNETELMDEEGIAFDEFHDCLIGLERINHLTLAYRPTLQWLSNWLRRHEPLYILDVACGGGDMLRQIAKANIKLNAKRNNKAKSKAKSKTENRIKNSAKNKSNPDQITAKNHCTLVGIDLNPWAKIAAGYASKESGNADCSITYETANIFEFEPAQPIDLIISSLFTHHLTNSQIVDFLRWMDSRARKGWFINDLHRHPLAYYFIKVATALFSRNRLIRNDAAVSVARAFSVADWRHLIKEAGLQGRVSIQWFFPFRLCISCDKPRGATSALLKRTQGFTGGYRAEES